MTQPLTSYLAAVPAIVTDEDVLYIDGIRYASEMIRISYERLSASLLHINDEENQSKHMRMATSAMHDAWSIIDCAYRLSGLIFLSKIAMEATDIKESFKSISDPISKLRNIINHTSTLIPNHAKGKLPVWGALKWFVWKEHPHTGISFQFFAGKHVIKKPIKVDPPKEQHTLDGLTDVFLSHKGIEVSIREILSTINDFSLKFESHLAKLTNKHGVSHDHFSDVLISVSVDFRNK